MIPAVFVEIIAYIASDSLFELLESRDRHIEWYSFRMDKVKILAAAKAELLRHKWGTFVDQPPSIAEGGNGVVVAGCETCKKRANTMNQYMEHLANDALPVILCRAFAIAQETAR